MKLAESFQENIPPECCSEFGCFLNEKSNGRKNNT
jgi:hypothetical protein